VSVPRSRNAPQPRSALALDVGRRRIGLAGCDPLGLTVTPLPALRRGAFADDLAFLLPLLRSRAVTALVVGLPLDAAQRPTTQGSTTTHSARYRPRQVALLTAHGRHHELLNSCFA
jgi:putative Holliday junction resolvase